MPTLRLVKSDAFVDPETKLFLTRGEEVSVSGNLGALTRRAIRAGNIEIVSEKKVETVEDDIQDDVLPTEDTDNQESQPKNRSKKARK